MAASTSHTDQAPLKMSNQQVKSYSDKSIAVLPFVNMSADPDNEYFSDGITEEIINALTTIQGLKVIARTSSFAFKNKNIDVRTIGHQLGVNTILEGSVRKARNRVRITAQLISTDDGTHFWSRNFDRELKDILPYRMKSAYSLPIKSGRILVILKYPLFLISFRPGMWRLTIYG